MLHVTSEIGRLRKVLVHEPGREIDVMVPAMMDELLFDDVLFGDRAREEHAMFRRVLQLLGIEMFEAQDLLAETLADPEARDWVVEVLLREMAPALHDKVEEVSEEELAEMLVAGVRAEPGRQGVEVAELFAVPPLPNWCFQRDPQLVLGDGVVFAAMATPARHREALLSRAIFRFHPEFSAVPVIHDPLEPLPEHPLYLDQHRPRLEGGDVLVLSPEVVVVGHSERTNATATRALAHSLAHRLDGPRWMIAVEIPKRRAYMHLDTLITQVSHNEALVFPPVILADGAERAAVSETDLYSPDFKTEARGDLLSALKMRGIDLDPIPCGGVDSVQQQREQWTDGANAFALAPGVIALFDRNVATAEELTRHGYLAIHAKDLLLGREELDLDGDARVCVLLPSHEMSRARGGPHCLTHPLVRD